MCTLIKLLLVVWVLIQYILRFNEFGWGQLILLFLTQGFNLSHWTIIIIWECILSLNVALGLVYIQINIAFYLLIKVNFFIKVSWEQTVVFIVYVCDLEKWLIVFIKVVSINVHWIIDWINGFSTMMIMINNWWLNKINVWMGMVVLRYLFLFFLHVFGFQNFVYFSLL